MIVWLSSYPRSGNTFLRIVLHRVYGVTTSTVYPVDGVAARLGAEAIGFREAGPDAALRADEAVHFVKTHRRRDAQIADADGAICLVRDGRDATVSAARQRSEGEPDQFEAQARAMILRRTGGTGGWGQNVLSWLDRGPVNRRLLRYEDLVRDALEAVSGALSAVAPGLRTIDEQAVPTFAELHATDPAFFRRGVLGSARDELPAELHDLFWAQPDNAEAMARLGYRR